MDCSVLSLFNLTRRASCGLLRAGCGCSGAGKLGEFFRWRNVYGGWKWDGEAIRPAKFDCFTLAEIFAQEEQ